MKNRMLLIWLLCLGMVLPTQAQKLEKFTADLGKKVVLGKEVRLPYTAVNSYYGYIMPGSNPDEVRDGKKFYYLYIWIPVAAPELGIRMVSPIPKGMVPEDGDFIGANYKENVNETSNYFDTWITLERADGILKVEDIMNASTATWNSYGYNDDSGEMPSQPSGSKYNSLMRISSDVNDPLKALVVGLYRVGFTTYKTGEVQGGFVAQLGAPVKLPGVAVASNLPDLVKLLEKK